MTTDSAFGSLRVVPKRPGHVHGDFNDSTTTIMHKRVAMLNGIDLKSPAAVSYRRHVLWRRVAIGVLLVAGMALCVVFWRWVTR